VNAVLELSRAWTGLGTAIVRSIIGAATVVLGVWFAQQLKDKRARSEGRRKAGDQLIIQVSNLRDVATRSQVRRLAGDYEVWPLRTELYITQTALRGLPSYQETWAFYEAVRQLQAWLSEHPQSNDYPDTSRTPDQDKVVDQYIVQLDAYGDRLIEMLQQRLEDRHASIEGAEGLPQLPA
jgi:hypothetical protein